MRAASRSCARGSTQRSITRAGRTPAPPGRASFAVLVAIAAVVAILSMFAPVRVARADDPLAAKEMEVERQLGCPICTNLPLNVCDNQICTQMKDIIHQKLADGETPDAVVAYFVSRY